MGFFTPQVASSLVSGIFGMFGQSRQIKAQQRENELAFQRNKALAQLQNQFNIDQWHRANAYNSPANQMKLLKQAGLNPDLAMNGTSGMTAATSPSMSAGTPYAPVDHTLGGTRKTFGDIFNTIMQNRLLESQIGKTDSEKTGIDIDNKTLFEMNQAELKQYYSNIGLNEKQIEMMTKQIEKLDVDMKQSLQQIELLKSQIDFTDTQTWSTKINTALKEKEVEIQQALADSNIKMNNTQIHKIMQMLPYEIASLDMNNQEAYSRVLVNMANHAGLLHDNETKALDAFFAKRELSQYQDGALGESVATIVGVSQMLGKVISSVVPVLGKIK